MKDTINRLARGEFMSDVLELNVVPKHIDESLPINEARQKELKISSNHSLTKGVVYSDNPRVCVEKEFFSGKESVVSYTVDTNGVAVGDTLKGSFSIVSNAGEFVIKYAFKVVEKCINTSIGPVHNLFHFANLVSVASDEAGKIFLRDDFENIFLKNDIKLCAIYRALKTGSNVHNSMEEFLIAVHKKQPVNLSIVEDDGKEVKNSLKNYAVLEEDFKDEIKLHKNTWGYMQLPVTCDSEFIKLEHNFITSDNFAGNDFSLEYLVLADKLHAGNNYARIRVGLGEGSVVREIQIIPEENKRVNKTIEHTVSMQTMTGITKYYILFRSNKIKVTEWASRSSTLLEKAMAKLPDKSIYKLMQAQIYCITGQNEKARWLLDEARKDILLNKESLEHFYYIYVESLYKKDEIYTKEVCEALRRQFEDGNRAWEILGMLFYVDPDYDRNPSIKLARIKEMFRLGCHSPIMYLEACLIINDHPGFLRVFDEFEKQVINFGCKYDVLNAKVARQICEIGQADRGVTEIYLGILKSLHKKFGDDNILTLLCEHMIRNQMVGPKYFDIYETCILRNLRITRLYEFYMASISTNYNKLLPKMVLMYFSYNNQLNSMLKAFMYSNILKYMKDDDPLKPVYYKQMEEFAIEQLTMGQISDNHVNVYKNIWNEALITQNTAMPVSRLLFAYKLTCFEPGITNVILQHKELNIKTKVPIIDNVAYVSIYTEDICIAFEDADNQLHKDTVPYELEKLMDKDDYIDTVYDYMSEDIYLLIYYYEQYQKHKKIIPDIVAISEKLINSADICESFDDDIQNLLIDYYFEKYNNDDIESKLMIFDKRPLKEAQAVKLIEIFITRNLYEKAYDYALLYGVRNVDVKQLYKLLRYLLEKEADIENKFIIWMCIYVYSNNQYDAKMLTYLQKYYNQKSEDMFVLLERCKGFNVDTYELSERIVAQLIFTKGDENKLAKVFLDYYEQGAKERIIAAFIVYESYNYFIDNKEIDDKLFRIIESRLEYNDDVVDIARLALLLFYSKKESLQENELKRTKNLLGYFASRDMLFGFYRDLADKISLPYKAVDKTVVEYRTNPGSKVTIHYKMSDGIEEYTEEIMPNVFMGIFTKAFTLFYGESVQYYISEVYNGEEKITEPMSITCKTINMKATKGRYEYINDMLASKDSHDLITLNKLMHSYSVMDYVTKEMFKIK